MNDFKKSQVDPNNLNKWYDDIDIILNIDICGILSYSQKKNQKNHNTFYLIIRQFKCKLKLYHIILNGIKIRVMEKTDALYIYINLIKNVLTKYTGYYLNNAKPCSATKYCHRG